MSMLRKSLGRGLEALIPGAELSADSALTPSALPLDQIAPSPFQPRRRFAPEPLHELAEAIRRQGVIEPLIVRPRTGGGPPWELIAGERRLRAAREAGLTEVPVVVRELDDRSALEVSLIENLAREDLTPIEEAHAFARLTREFNLGHEEVAARIGKSRPHVSNTIRLLDLSAAVLELIESGDLSAGQARPLLSLPQDEQIAAARRIVAGRISARGAEQLASERRPAARPGKRRAASDPNLAAVAEDLQRALKRKVRVARSRGKTPGRIEIDYYNNDDLTALVRMLIGASTARSAAASL